MPVDGRRSDGEGDLQWCQKHQAHYIETLGYAKQVTRGSQNVITARQLLNTCTNSKMRQTLAVPFIMLSVIK